MKDIIKSFYNNRLPFIVGAFEEEALYKKAVLSEIIRDPLFIIPENSSDIWFMPSDFKEINIEEFLYSLCKTQEEIERVSYELSLYKKLKLYMLLRFLIFFSSTIRKKKLFIGLGRGSSVSSYVLYLLGIHKVNSLKYNLDIHEFLK